MWNPFKKKDNRWSEPERLLSGIWSLLYGSPREALEHLGMWQCIVAVMATSAFPALLAAQDQGAVVRLVEETMGRPGEAAVWEEDGKLFIYRHQPGPSCSCLTCKLSPTTEKNQRGNEQK